ncbi:MAG: DNA-binding transcriptional regulator [Kiritimatiellae bacterium]|nr:DNA-binding transcriptional regulator [Kiritimatiellia bacterium]MDD5519721.1 DNA-binding transcriptional regulator [Kiritimatiellia bacterium]
MTANVKTRSKVALLIETSNAYARGLLGGVVAYMRENRTWSIYLAEHGRGDKPPAWLADWKGNGIIARIENRDIAKALTNLNLPIVDVSAARLIPSIPWVETDDKAFARLAAEHLLERGFKNFAYCGDDRFNWSIWRSQHFPRFIAAAGHKCSVYSPSKRMPADAESHIEDIAEWVTRLPKPVGVMACYDLRGQQVLDACRRRNIAVPDEVAVIGVDNDELLCSLSDPPLSSIIPNNHRTGFEAAAILDRMMSGKKVKSLTNLIPPLGVAMRQSTDVLAIEDKNIVQAVRYIREHACEGINVDDVLRAAPQSRRVLETRFNKLLGRTPHEEILHVQLNRVKELLAESDLSLETIAERAGFEHPEYLSVAFKREIGMPPSKYRALNHH